MIFTTPGRIAEEAFLAARDAGKDEGLCWEAAALAAAVDAGGHVAGGLRPDLAAELDAGRERAAALQAELGALADSLGAAVRAAAETERKRAEAAEAKAALYESGVTWETSCLSCAAVLDSAVTETFRREAAEGEVERLRAELAERDRLLGLTAEFMTPAGAARALGVDTPALISLANGGRLVTAPHVRNGHRRYLTASVRALMAEQAGGLLSPAEAAAALGVRPKELVRLEAEGKVESVRTAGNHRRYREPSVMALARQREAARSVPRD